MNTYDPTLFVKLTVAQHAAQGRKVSREYVYCPACRRLIRVLDFQGAAHMASCPSASRGCADLKVETLEIGNEA